jgi:arylformamidase
MYRELTVYIKSCYFRIILLKGKKIFVYIHGGYWQWGSVNSSAFMAKNFIQNGFIVAAIGYKIAPEGCILFSTFKILKEILIKLFFIKVNIHEIVAQVERGVAKILQFAENSNVYIAGHSAGGHLAAMMLYTDFKKKFKIEPSPLRAIIPVSGVFDLTPFIKTDINDNVKMSIDDARIVSPLLTEKVQLDESQIKNIHILLAYGENESPEFKRQSQEYSNVRKIIKF